MNERFDLLYSENRKVKLRLKQNRFGRLSKSCAATRDFKCVHCGNPVSTDPVSSGVNNRNHCPYCLWSKHMDLYQAGDRLSVCKAQMRPIGLTLKRTRKKYGPQRGELMLVHQCIECDKLSINRIAADDIAEELIEVYEYSTGLETSLRARFEECGIEFLQAEELCIVYAQLFGEQPLSPCLLVD